MSVHYKGSGMRFSVLSAASLMALAASASFASATTCDGTFSYTGTIEYCTVANTGDYSITAFGAQGGTGAAGPGGLGAEIAGVLSLTAGEEIEIVVGGQGGIYPGRGGGGGGSFVVEVGTGPIYTPLVIAGGGGGAAANSANEPASSTQNGAAGGTTVPGSSSGAGGTGGNGGQGSSSSYSNGGDGGGGGGFYTAGTAGLTALYTGGGGGQSFLGGALGGTSADGAGGFGGGGGGGGNNGGGGGGGYSGGGGGGDGAGGGGGGSFLDPDYTLALLVGNENAGDGRVFITESETIVTSAVTPLPGTLPLLATGLGAMGLFGWRRKRKNTATIAA